MDPVQYPVNFSVDYPDRDLNRLTTFFRIFTVIPIAIVAGAARARRSTRRIGDYDYVVRRRRAGLSCRPC